MLLTLTATMPGARDLGHLVAKHPDRAQSFPLPAGTAHVVWPEAGEERATVALVLEVDPVALARGRAHRGQHVTDRPYAASSLLSVAIASVFRSGMSGRSKERPDLAAQPLPLEVHVPALPTSGGPALVEELFAPLGWSVDAIELPLDPTVPAWGDAPYVDCRLTGTVRVADALTQLYVLIPVLDGGHHHWVGEGEVEKLLRAGAAWLPGHPARQLITARYLGHHRELLDSAAARAVEMGDAVPDEPAATTQALPATPLARLRAAAVVAALHEQGARTVVDLGCGEGALLRELLADPAFTAVVGADVSARALAVAERRFGLDRMPDTVRERLRLLQSSATYRDDRLAGHDALVLVEVVEHVEPERLPALERSVFAHARPRSVVVTTPNAEHNALYPHLPAGHLRHPDHRFEWTREQFRSWSHGVAQVHGYDVRYLPVGEDHPELGPPTQMAVFARSS